MNAGAPTADPSVSVSHADAEADAFQRRPTRSLSKVASTEYALIYVHQRGMEITVNGVCGPIQEKRSLGLAVSPGLLAQVRSPCRQVPRNGRGRVCEHTLPVRMT